MREVLERRTVPLACRSLVNGGKACCAVAMGIRSSASIAVYLRTRHGAAAQPEGGADAWRAP